MGKILRIPLLAVLLCLCPPVQATTYYVCDCGTGADPNCVVGSDANPGTSPAAPWQTLNMARNSFNSLQAGDQILFAQGGSFSTSGPVPLDLWFNTNSTPANPIVLDEYLPPWAVGTPPLPILATTTVDDLLRFENSGAPIANGGYVIRNLDLRGVGATSTGNGIKLSNTTNVLIDNVTSDSFAIGVYLAGTGCAGITLRNSTLVNNNGFGLLAFGNNLLVDNNQFTNNGYAESVFDHNIYLSAHTLGQNVTISNNNLYQNNLVGGQCSATSLVVHGIWHGLVIEYNTVREDVGAAGGGCWGIAVVPGGYTGVAEDFTGTIIRGNKIINVGNESIIVASCPDCLIENNAIVQQQAFGANAINASADRGTGDSVQTAVTVRNNSIYMSSPAYSTGIWVGDEGTNYVVSSNAIYDADTSNTFAAFYFNLPAADYSSIDYNLFYHPNAAGAPWEGVTGDSLAAWRAATPFDAHSLIGNPLFTSPGSPNDDLSLSSAASPAVNAGDPLLSATTDITGRARDSMPDIGAYEYFPPSTPTATPTGTWYTPTPTVTATPTPSRTTTSTSTPNPQADLLYPNPWDGSAPLAFYHKVPPNTNREVLKVLTVSYRKVYEDYQLAATPGLHLYTLDWHQAGNLANGLYYVVLAEQSGGRQTNKVMKLLVRR